MVKEYKHESLTKRRESVQSLWKDSCQLIVEDVELT